MEQMRDVGMDERCDNGVNGKMDGAVDTFAYS